MGKAKKMAAISILVITAMVGASLALFQACKPPKAAVTVGVATDNFGDATRSAMDIINGYIGCEAFVPGGDALVVSANAEPCGNQFSEVIRNGASAGTYRCSPGSKAGRGYRWEIHIEQPGDIHTQVCIVAHGLGRIAGLKDSNRGIMNGSTCPERIHLTDHEVSLLRRQFCR